MWLELKGAVKEASRAHLDRMYHRRLDGVIGKAIALAPNRRDLRGQHRKHYEGTAKRAAMPLL